MQVRPALIYVDQNRYLEGSLTTWPLRQKNRFLPGTYDFPKTPAFDQIHSSSHKMSPAEYISNQEAIGCSIADTPWSQLWTHLAWQVSKQGLVLDETTHIFSHPAAYTVPSSTMTGRQQAGDFLVSSRSIALCPITKIWGVFGDSILPSGYGGWPREIATACNVLDASETCLTSNLYRDIWCLELRFSLNRLCLLWATLAIPAGYLCSNLFFKNNYIYYI